MTVLVSLDMDESTQVDSFQNSSFHRVTSDVVCSLAITPKYPSHVKTEEDAAKYLIEQLSALSRLGWVVEAQIGKSDS
jgi:hypothetical protein